MSAATGLTSPTQAPTTHSPHPPVRSIVTGSNAELIAEAARLYIDLESDLVMDVTWGRGRWWTIVSPFAFIAHDLYTLDGVDFRQLPEPDGSVDVIAYDPPYTSPGGRSTSTIPDFNSRYGLVDVPRTVAETQAMIAAGLKECGRALTPGGRILAKTCDYVSSGHLQLGRHHLVTAALDLGMEQLDEFVHVTGTGPQPALNLDGTPRRQVHSRRAHSFLCVFSKPGRRYTQCYPLVDAG